MRRPGCWSNNRKDVWPSVNKRRPEAFFINADTLLSKYSLLNSQDSFRPLRAYLSCVLLYFPLRDLVFVVI